MILRIGAASNSLLEFPKVHEELFVRTSTDRSPPAVRSCDD